MTSMTSNEGKPRILVFASGDKKGGGSGFQEMVEYTRTSPAVLNAEIVAVVSNHSKGGVHKKAQKLSIPFEYWNAKITDIIDYNYFVQKYMADYVMLSGWLKLYKDAEPGKVINIHPGPLPAYGGQGMYGHFVHEAVINDFHAGKTTQSAVTMHFVDKKYDRGPIIHQAPVLIRDDDTPETIARRVNEVERVLQARVLNRVVQGDIFYHEGKVFYKDNNPKNEWYL